MARGARPKGDIGFSLKAGVTMTPLTGSLAAAAALAALTVCAAGCQSATSTVVGAGLNSAAPSAPATAAPASAPAPGAPSGAPSAAVAASTAPASAPAVVYLAEGGSVTGTAEHAPACPAGCVLSGDSTTSMWDMTWTTWNSVTAVGAGTEKLDDCTPNCAAGTQHAVPVKVTLSRPVVVCTGGAGRWFWTRVSFTWPKGLPAAFSGGNAPLNPFDYDGLASQAAKTCP
jgi:hypothetical protein